MAVLNDWQKISRVKPGKPFGDGLAGDATISSDALVRATITGSAAQANVTAGNTNFANGDVVFMIQMKNTGYGQHEINQVLSGGGTTSLVMKKNLQYAYTTGAQMIKISMHRDLTINAHTVTGWGGSTGGIAVYAGQRSITVSGAITGNGGAGSHGTSDNSYGGSGGGFRGGNVGLGGGSNYGFAGEGYSGSYPTRTASAEGNGGGGGSSSSDGSGGGGGNANAGSNGTKGTGGSAGGSADLTSMVMGGGGGGGTQDYSPDGGGGGGAGGAIVVLISKSITLSANINVNGGNGGDRPTWNSDGGSGAGGSVLLVCRDATLGTNKINAAGGSGGSGGAGSYGRIAVHHSGAVTGTTNPTFTDVTDSSLFERPAGAGLLMLL